MELFQLKVCLFLHLWLVLALIKTKEIEGLKCYHCEGSCNANATKECSTDETCYATNATNKGCYPKLKADCIDKEIDGSCYTPNQTISEKITACFAGNSTSSGAEEDPGPICICSDEDLCNDDSLLESDDSANNFTYKKKGNSIAISCFSCSSDKKGSACWRGDQEELGNENVVECQDGVCATFKNSVWVKRQCAPAAWADIGECLVDEMSNYVCVNNATSHTAFEAKCVEDKVKITMLTPGELLPMELGRSDGSKFNLIEMSNKEEISKRKGELDRPELKIELLDDEEICFCTTSLCNAASEKYSVGKWRTATALMVAIFSHFSDI